MPHSVPVAGNVTFLLRLDRRRRLVVELDALFGYSIGRAMESLERSEEADFRLAITYRLLGPLERARRVLRRAGYRQGPAQERLLLPADIVALAQMQYRALCHATINAEFPWSELPEALADPFAARDRLARALGHERADPQPTTARAS